MLSIKPRHDTLDLLIITLRECSTWSLVMYSSYDSSYDSCYDLLWSCSFP